MEQAGNHIALKKKKAESCGEKIEVCRPPLGIVYAPVKTLWSGWGTRNTSAGPRVFGGAYTLSAWLRACKAMKRNNKKRKEKTMKKIFLIAALTAVSAVAMVSCNVTRTVTTQSQYIQKNDTNIVIQTKTIETYDASKKGL